MNYSTWSDSRATDEILGEKWREMSMPTQDFVDAIIRAGHHKITTIKFLRNELGLRLDEAKRLYEGLQEFLTRTNSFGF